MMVSGSGVRQVPCFLLGGFGGLRRAVLEAKAVVSAFKNVAAVGEPIEHAVILASPNTVGPLAEAPKLRLVVMMTLEPQGARTDLRHSLQLRQALKALRWRTPYQAFCNDRRATGRAACSSI